MRIALGIEYDGTAYNGWQRQKAGLGVQQCVEKALQKVASHAVETICAGRTDTGVHARGQVVHFDTPSRRSERGWLLGANSNLPDDISVMWAREVSDDFHARFSATARNYRYVILNRLERSALYRNRAWWVHQELSVPDMHEAAQLLVGEHDFSAFCAAGCRANTPFRKVTRISVQRSGDWVRLDISANAFLQHMVRNITGALLAVGDGSRPISWLQDILDGRDRKHGGIAAPSQGLTLESVEYPQLWQLPVPPVDDWL